jgi:hypothetical protein
MVIHPTKHCLVLDGWVEVNVSGKTAYLVQRARDELTRQMADRLAPTDNKRLSRDEGLRAAHGKAAPTLLDFMIQLLQVQYV